MPTQPDPDPERVARTVASLLGEIVYFDLDVFSPPGEYQARLTLGGTHRTFRLTAVDCDRALAELLGLGAPAGFRDEPMPVTNRRSRKEKEFVAEFNRERIRWVADVPIGPGATYVLRVPARRQEAGFGTLCLTFAWQGEQGGTTFSRHAPIGLADPRGARRAMDGWNAFRLQHERFVAPLPARQPESDYGTFRAHTTPLAGGRLPPRRRRDGEG